MVVAGEASGDDHAARLIEALRRRTTNTVEFFGCAGPKMRAAGVDAVVEADELSMVGFLEIGGALPKFLSVFNKLKDAALERRPDAAVLVDFPEFNLKLARSLKKAGIKVVYYISPQLWAWRKYRKRTIRDSVDLLLSIMPFEREWYEREGIHGVEYVGNPLVDEVRPQCSGPEFRKELGIADTAKVIAMLPGSRGAEVKRVLPIFSRTASELSAGREDLEFLVAFPKGHQASRQVLESKFSNLRFLYGRTYDVLNAANAAAITSGTATLEAAILGTPMVIVYKASILNYALLRPLISVDNFGLVNLIAKKRIVTELIQHDLTPRTLAEELSKLLDPEVSLRIKRELGAAVAKLGGGGASERAADAIIRLLELGR
jgi:lipid-A-disaccharide synthase